MYLSTREWLVVRRVLIPMVLCALVAAMDESIQLFIDGRSGQLSDVLLDSCGAWVGIWLAYLIASRMKSCVKRRI